MSSNYTTNLKNKRVISVTGDESEVFLNNIITNDIKKIKACLDQNGQDSIYSSYPTVGFLNDTFKKIERMEGIRFKFFNSEWDLLFWPHAKRGFLKLNY